MQSDYAKKIMRPKPDADKSKKDKTEYETKKVRS